MTCDLSALAVAGVQALSPYQAGKPIEELQRELGLARVVKLASNENPLGPSSQVLDACRRALPELHRYPDSNGFGLKQALAAQLAVQPTMLTLGNGSNDVLDLVARTFLGPGRSAVFSQHAFVVYPIATQACGARAIVVPATQWGHDLAAMAAAVDEDTRVVFIANPNNPTGTWLTESALRTFLQRVPESVIVVLDEAYIEYAAVAEFPDGVALLRDFPNLIVTRTFSKAYGLPGLRVGYSVSSPVIADLMNRVRAPFNVNSLGLVAAAAALADADYLARGRALNAQGMRQLEQGLKALGLSWIPSAGNFLAVDMGREAMPLYLALLKRGVIVRPVGVYQMPNHLRVTVGLEEENQFFLDALSACLEADA